MIDPDRNESMTMEQIQEHMAKEGKKSPSVSNKTFLLAAGIGVPIWFGGLLPLAIATTLGKKVLSNSSSESTNKIPAAKKNENEVFPSIENIPPMENRIYDLVVFGATGFAGKLSIEHLVKTYGVNKDVKWAIAGRTKAKLEDAKAKVAKLTGDNSIMEVETIIADTK